MGHETITTPLSRTVCQGLAGMRYDQAVHQIWNLYVHPLRTYERRQQYRNWGSLGVRGSVG